MWHSCSAAEHARNHSVTESHWCTALGLVMPCNTLLPGHSPRCPVADVGTKDGWHYIYPIHEAPVNDRTAKQGKPAS